MEPIVGLDVRIRTVERTTYGIKKADRTRNYGDFRGNGTRLRKAKTDTADVWHLAEMYIEAKVNLIG